MTVFIPRTLTAPGPGTATIEIVVRGRILAPDKTPLTPAVVTVLQISGEPVDWSQVDTEGNYSIAVPGAGKYLMVANTAGWTPVADVFEFDGLTVQHNFLLRDRLKITGVVRSRPEGIAGAVVTSLEGTGRHVATTQTSDDGT